MIKVDDSGLIFPDGSRQLTAGAASRRNLLINGNFSVWQRGVSSTASGYLADRWNSADVGSTKTTSRQLFTLGQTTVPDNPKYFHRVLVTAAGSGVSDYTLLDQRVEGLQSTAGKTVTLSFWAKADASKNIASLFYQKFGAGGSADTNSTPVTHTLTTTWTKFTNTWSVPSLAGKTIGSTQDSLYVRFFFEAGSTFNSVTNSLGHRTGTFDIAQVQLEIGSVATKFELRPKAVELALCQRYFQLSRWDYGTYNSGGVRSRGTTSLPVTMRTTPSIVNTPDVGTNCTSPAMVALSPDTEYYEHIVTALGSSFGSGNCTLSAEI